MHGAPLPPPTGTWTPEAYDALPADGYRRELIEGVLHVAAPPSGRHQLLAGLLMAHLYATAPPDIAVTQGVEVRLSPTLRYVPDVLAMTLEAYDDGRASQYDPLDVVLAVEIVSESSRAMDRLVKPYHYATAGIPIYWRMELDPQVTVSMYRADITGEYEETGVFDKVLGVTKPWPVELDLRRLPV
jgi:Uma2 family endonuclease